MSKAGRLGDQAHAPDDAHDCPSCSHGVTGPATAGSPDVEINGRAALRVGDTGVHDACCGDNTWVAADGAATVLINGLPAFRLGDPSRHCGGDGQLVEGSPDVQIDDADGAPAAAPALPPLGSTTIA